MGYGERGRNTQHLFLKFIFYLILSPYTKAVTQSDGKIELNKIKNN